jgi:glutamate dehydrogenase
MDLIFDASRRERLERLKAALALAVARLPAEPQGSALAAFADARVPQLHTADLLECDPADLCGALLSRWRWGAQRTPGRAKVRVLSRTSAEDGWASRHSVIELIDDELPFLVDGPPSRSSGTA